jgi:hypothetical protein
LKAAENADKGTNDTKSSDSNANKKTASDVAGKPKPTSSDEPALTGPAKEAAGFQGSGRYPGVDNWTNGTIPKGTTVYQGSPAGSSKFFFPQSALDASGLDAKTLGEGLQISPHPTLGYRTQVTSFTTTADTPAAFADTTANPAYGPGGFDQLYIPDTSTLQPVTTIPLTGGKP